MQRAEGSSPPRAVPEPSPARPGLSPLVAFLLLFAVIGAIGALAFLLRPDAPTPTEPRSATEPNFALTDAEAIERFEELQGLHILAYASHDSSLVSQVFVPGSTMSRTVSKELRQLARDRVLASVSYSSREVAVASSTHSEIQIRQVARVESSFVDESGEDITTAGRPEIQEILWTLQRVDDQWFISDSLIVDAQPIGSNSK